MIHVSLYSFIKLYSFHIYLLLFFFLYVFTINHEDKGV